MWPYLILFGPHYNRGLRVGLECFFDLWNLILHSYHSVNWVQLGISLIFMKKLGEYDLFDVTQIVCGGAHSGTQVCWFSAPNSDVRGREMIAAQEEELRWWQSQLPVPGPRPCSLLGAGSSWKGLQGPSPDGQISSLHHCLPSWLHASCLTSHVYSPSRVFHFCSALSFGIPVLVFFPGYLFMSWFIACLILTSPLWFI